MKMSDVFNLPLVVYDTVHGYKVIRDDFDVSCNEGDYDKFESAAAHAINNHDRMADEIADLIAVLSNTINGWDCEEVAHHCGVDVETASRVINLLNK